MNAIPRGPVPPELRDGAPFAALAFDLDGTLLKADMSLAPRAPEAVALLRARGIPTHIVTGRMQPSALGTWRACGLDTAIVSYNGAKIAVPGQPAQYHAALGPGIAAAVHDHCQARGWHLNHYVDDHVLVPEVTRPARWYADVYQAPIRCLPLADILEGPASTKLLVIPGDPWDGPAAVEAELHRAWRELSDLCGDRATVLMSSRLFVEIIAPGVNKGSGLQHLAGITGIPVERWVGVGDGHNDVDLVKTAGLGVGVAGGEAGLLAAADWTVPPLWEDGLAVLLREAFGVRLP